MVVNWNKIFHSLVEKKNQNFHRCLTKSVILGRKEGEEDMKVKLSEIAENMEMQMDEYYTMFDRKTYTFIMFSEEAFRAADNMEPSDHLPEWQQDERKWAEMYIEDSDRLVSLPDKYDIDEYEMMEDFCYQLEDKEVKDRLLIAIRGRGAFRRFKDQILRDGVREDWFQFRDERYKVLAKVWCEENDIQFEE